MSWDPPQPPGLRARVQQPPLNPGIYSLENHGGNGISWSPKEYLPFHYVEAYQYDNTSTCVQDLDLRHGVLHEKDAEDWLQSRHQPVDTHHGHDRNKAVGSLHILFCQRSGDHPPKVSCSASTFSKICAEFKLACETEASLTHILGSFGKHVINIDQTVGRLQIVMKAYQKREIGNFTLSCSYDFTARRMDALIIWRDSTDAKHQVLDGPFESRKAYIIAMLQAMPSMWAQPLLVPLLVVRSYADRARIRGNVLATELAILDARLGVNRAGRIRAPEGSLENWPQSLPFKPLMAELHSLHNRLIANQQASMWSKCCLDFLREVQSELQGDFPQACLWSRQIKECLDHDRSLAQCALDSIEAQKSRATNATNLLFNALNQKEAQTSQNYNRLAQEQSTIARRDNLLNIKIASSAKADSIAMKTFTFITALFLPGTFIGTILSATMIEWLSSSTGTGNTHPSGVRISSLYWVYWALTVPITIAVMFGWYLWYRRETRKWENEVKKIE